MKHMYTDSCMILLDPPPKKNNALIKRKAANFLNSVDLGIKKTC